MNEIEKLSSQISDLIKTVESLRCEISSLSISKLTYYENLAPGAVVGVDYVAHRFGCTESAVVRGRFDTDKIPRLRNKPLKFLKRNVDSVWMNLNKTSSEKAAEIRHNVNKNKKMR